ncbi:MAG: ABC transporter permease, partial [Chthoniobacteraceae bacterium]
NVNKTPVTIIGVAPREFTGSTRGEEPELYLPITMLGRLDGSVDGDGGPLRVRHFTWMNVIGRLNDGVSLAQAETAMRTLGQQIALENPVNTPDNLMVLPGSQGFNESTREVREPLRLLFLVAGFILLLVCANLANMQLARATGRGREFAIRMALGVQRRRIIRQLLTESLLLAGMGGCLGLLVAFWITRALRGLEVAQFPGMLEGGLDHRVLWFGFFASILTGVIFGLAPAWRASRVPIVAQLKNGGDAPRSGFARWNPSDLLVIVQIALAVIVLLSAGLCGRSLYRLQKVSPGFEPSQVLLATLDSKLDRPDKEREEAFFNQILETVRTLPGAEAVALAVQTPLGGGLPGNSIERIDGHEPKPKEHLFADTNTVSADYFRALRIPLLRGREFDNSDVASGPRTVIVNEQFAQRYLPDQDPIGKRITLKSRETGSTFEIVGVAADTPNRSLTDSPRQTMFFPVSQNPGGNLTLILRTGLAPATATSWIRETVRRIDPNVPLLNVRTMSDQLAGTLGLQRLAAILLGGFAVLALLLAGLGVYGVLAYSVSRRTREIGIRKALGAQTRDVLALVVRHGMVLSFVGLLLGFFGAFGTTRLLHSLLYQVDSLDPLTFAVVAVLLIAVGFFASWLPARRASSVNPTIALSTE